MNIEVNRTISPAERGENEPAAVQERVDGGTGGAETSRSRIGRAPRSEGEVMDLTQGITRPFVYQGVKVTVRVNGDAAGWSGWYELTFPPEMHEPMEKTWDDISHSSADMAIESCVRAAKRRVDSKLPIRGTRVII